MGNRTCLEGVIDRETFRSGWKIGRVEGVVEEAPGRRSCRETRSGSKYWTPGRRSCGETRSEWKNRTCGRRSCRETRSGWKIEGLEGVVAQKLYLDGK